MQPIIFDMKTNLPSECQFVYWIPPFVSHAKFPVEKNLFKVSINEGCSWINEWKKKVSKEPTS